MANDSNAIRVPDDLLQRLESDAIARLVSPFTKPTRALLVRAVLEQGLIALEARVPPSSGMRPSEATMEQINRSNELGELYAREEFAAGVDGAKEWSPHHEGYLVRDLGRDPNPIELQNARASFSYTFDALTINARERAKRAAGDKPRVKRAPRKASR